MKRKVEYFEIKVQTAHGIRNPYLVVWIGRTHVKYHRNDDEIYFPGNHLFETLQRLQREFVKGKFK